MTDGPLTCKFHDYGDGMRMIEFPDGTSEPFSYSGDVPGITIVNVGDEPPDSFEAVVFDTMQRWQQRTPDWKRYQEAPK